MSIYHDDPTPLVESLENAWERYIADGQQLFDQVLSQVVEWRFTEDEHLIPRHPFSNVFDVVEYSNWRPRAIRFVDENPESQQVRHGFDDAGRVVVAGVWIVRYQEGFHDILGFQRHRNSQASEGTDQRLPYQPHFRSGFPQGGFRRCWTDERGRIVQTARLSNEGEESHRHYRTFEQFRREGDRIVESFRQSFTRATEVAELDRDLDPQELAKRDRRIHDNLREVMSMRSRFEYSYDDTGVLSQVAEYKTDGTLSEIWYSYNPNDTIENLTVELAAVVETAATKALKAQKSARPLRYVALQYSAEHAHCGLPAILLLASADEDIDPLDWEAYSHKADWPPEGRTGKKYEDLQCRLQVAVESAPQFAEDFQPRPYREVLWQASRGVYEALAGKRSTTDDFAVFPLDDHGDVDPAEDVRNSLPDTVADAVLARSQAE